MAATTRRTYYEPLLRTFHFAGKRLAMEKGLNWDMPCDALGKVPKIERWNLTHLSGLIPPPSIYLSDLGSDARANAVLNRLLAEQGREPIAEAALPSGWQDLLKAVVLNELLVKRNKPGHATVNVGRFIRILGSCADLTPPWELSAGIVQRAYNVALQIGESGKLAANLSMVVRTIIDGLHLTDVGPLAGHCVPYPTETAEAADKRVHGLKRGNNTSRRVDRLRSELSQRKGAAKLPEEKAFWELVRIVFTEQPKNFSDVIRFAEVKLAICTGFRVGETVMLPVDWERSRQHVDASGRPAGKKGGISRSLMIRHFAEKQAEDEGAEGLTLYETSQHVPALFEPIIYEALQPVERFTAVMRKRLAHQIETGRLLPEFERNDLVPAWDLYTRVGGSIRIARGPLPAALVEEYRATFNPEVLDQIRQDQIRRIHTEGLYNKIREYWTWQSHEYGLILRNRDGTPVVSRVDWKAVYLRIGEVEEHIRRHITTKLPDTQPFSLSDGTKVYSSDLLFILPVRAIVENRDGGIVDVNNYMANGRVSTSDLQLHLGMGRDNLFSRYGATDEDQGHRLNTHSLRHLQNAELFRLGVADTIITKRFNRRSAAQSYEYDHRSLAEDLARIDLPPEAERLGPRAQEVLQMIKAQRVSGPVVEEFLRVQRELGDDAAFDYLDAEADGLHVTPYGFCLNSFTVDPCPKHIECFNGCRHLARTGVPEEQHNLERLLERMLRVIAKIEGTPAGQRTVGWQNQLAHAGVRVENIRKVLAAAPGGRVFPEGPDLHRSIAGSATTILDTKPKIRRAE